MKKAFTMIELIFVMVIIGALAAVSIPKLAIARNDARASVIATRLGNCIELAGKGYLVSSSFDVNDSNCKDITERDNCYVITADDDNGTLNIKDVQNTTNKCIAGQKLTLKNKLSSAIGVIHSF